ncbi:hypothetical protein [Flavobacterium saccharophilum]|uniref:Uncharacterized protein n=1 Tax=Flavobacterium saccharophilum TaxID=29534 RepID=A0A1M7FQ59_9FLAO|nr:hypothetical protein [Flavobacterium saccharophilum]SHM05829.1 hypothetical protein SAMN05444366_2205 [Flavobacterium saccharophilum]
MQNILDRTNRFYLEMSRKLLSEKEYDVLEKLLMEKISLREAAQQYGVTSQYVEKLYQRAFSKAKEMAEMFSEIESYQKKLQELKRQVNPNPTPAQIRKEKTDKDRQKLLLNSAFPFSRRLQGVLETLEIKSIGELADIPLKDFQHFRGFKIKCKEELIAFIEFENIAYLFKGFSKWKKEPIEQLK